LVFCVSKSSDAERERLEPLEQMSVFAGNTRHRCSPSELIVFELKTMAVFLVILSLFQFIDIDRHIQ
jgi:hypothetical protein